MTKGKAKKGVQTSKEYEKFYESWLEFSKNINERLMKLTKEGTKEYEEMHKIWSEYVQKMTEKLANLSPEDKKAFKEMESLWTDYSSQIGERFLDLLSKKDGPYQELYQLYLDYSEKMGKLLLRLMSERVKEQNDLYELWMDSFGMKGKGDVEGINQLWMEMWSKSREILSPKDEEADYAVKCRELYDLWTKEYSKIIMNIMRSPAFAEMNGTILDKSLEMRRLNEQFMNQYLSAMGLPTKEGMNDIFRKLHELDRKVSEISRTIKSSKGPIKR